ncbi:phage capsid and scaffold [Aquitalea magnusonii]|uniref:Phage capsid and scaffold n=1 Tax=Aquitalea magnusonii TaxID=332411 RepID=A0A3G9GAJ7_9NEIS|nr:phage virion morphogenesis protein [Aquitalea magnusonii]BBF84434.1 phage capsid and scaffold [Aquitalea magnusonii]
MSDNSFEIQVINDSVGQALGQLLAQAHNLRPALLDFAEWAKAETDQRFADQADWHGQPWAPNAELTLANYLRNHGGSKNFKKDGKLSAAGTRRLAAKRILQVDGTLRRAAFSYDATSDSLRFGPWGNGLDAYAAIQNFGGQAGRGLKVTIPMRQYLPVDVDGTLAAPAEAKLLDMLATHFQQI